MSKLLRFCAIGISGIAIIEMFNGRYEQAAFLMAQAAFAAAVENWK